jgi:phosphopantothenoylcysteine decarboxylase/phosphopantothenate--cysteine ligase
MALVCLGVTGGISAYKAVEVARLLQQRGHDVRVVMTRSARRFIGPLTFEAITRHPVITGQFEPGLNANIEHIALASEAALVLVAPATANAIGKFANGIADDFLSSLYLATRAPVLVAPAMNSQMWDHPAVQDNLARLAARGVAFVEPGEGYLACGWVGKGRLAEPEVIVEAALARLAPARTLEGRRILVTAGPTYEDLDPVRYLGNRSSGRMGLAIAAESQRRGANVSLVCGPTTLPMPEVADLVRVRSAREMHAAVMARTANLDAAIMAAAVADYTPAGGADAQKIEKGGPLTLALERTADILKDLGERRDGAARPILIGFAAETQHIEARSRRKLDLKRADLIVANDVSAAGSGFDVDTNQVTLVTHADSHALPLMSKALVANAILDRLERLLADVPSALGAR